MIFNPVTSVETGGGIEKFSITVIGTAEGSIQVFDQSEQEWKTPSGGAMNIAIGKNLLIKTEVRLMNYPQIKQGDLSLNLNAIFQPLGSNTFGWYLPDVSGYYEKSINIDATAD